MFIGSTGPCINLEILSAFAIGEEKGEGGEVQLGGGGGE